jgi:hypothetical protein
MDTSTIKMKKSKKPRCFHCKKKLTLIELNFRCKCDNVYCQVHLNPHSHNCQVDYVQERQNKIKENNPKMCIQCIEVK